MLEQTGAGGAVWALSAAPGLVKQPGGRRADGWGRRGRWAEGWGAKQAHSRYGALVERAGAGKRGKHTHS